MMSNQPQSYHIPVLLKPAVDGLNIRPDGVYVDVTFGGGGHSREILKRLNDKGRLIAFDQDADAVHNTIDDRRFTLIEANFSNIKNFLRLEGIKQVDGILADLGVSSHQINKPERGFSTRFDEKLDMRMDKSADLTAYDVVNSYSEQDLKRIFFQYGDLKNAANLAKTIVKYRTEKPLKTTGQLNEIVAGHFPKIKQNKFLAKLYQAIRIEVNGEMEALKALLIQSAKLIKSGGRLSVISYHSLEDRLVKRFIRDGKFEGEAEKDFYGNISVPFKKQGKLIVPGKNEIERNPRARSAKLRIAQRTENNFLDK
jgi:16S rRNA (cytosine1402-N4)-methyltransferase